MPAYDHGLNSTVVVQAVSMSELDESNMPLGECTETEILPFLSHMGLSAFAQT